MNNQFTQRVSDIITYSKEEANRLRNSYIGPEHLLLGVIREGEGKAIEILLNLNINLQDIKYKLENILKRDSETDAIYDANINFNESASEFLSNFASKIQSFNTLDSARMKTKKRMKFKIVLQREAISPVLPNRHALPKRSPLMIRRYSIISVLT